MYNTHGKTKLSIVIVTKAKPKRNMVQKYETKVNKSFPVRSRKLLLNVNSSFLKIVPHIHTRVIPGVYMAKYAKNAQQDTKSNIQRSSSVKIKEEIVKMMSRAKMFVWN